MIHFMVDWENIQHNGLRGSKYLEQDDSVTIFYSAACNRIEQGDLQDLLQSGCTLELCKLVKPGKNALDHYIASRIGEVFGNGYAGHVAIVSRDKGFRAIQDYWKCCAEPAHMIALQPSIEACIASVNENTERHQIIQRALQTVNLEKEFAKYQETQRIRAELCQLFSGTVYQSCVNQIMDIVANQKTQSKVVYLNVLKQFGKKDGLEIYRRLCQWESREVDEKLAENKMMIN